MLKSEILIKIEIMVKSEILIKIEILIKKLNFDKNFGQIFENLIFLGYQNPRMF